jgi:plasmid stability protein
MAQILVRNLKPTVVARLKKRAARKGRSLESEVRAIIEREDRIDKATALEAIDRFRRSLGRRFSDSARLIREERDR